MSRVLPHSQRKQLRLALHDGQLEAARIVLRDREKYGYLLIKWAEIIAGPPGVRCRLS